MSIITELLKQRQAGQTFSQEDLAAEVTLAAAGAQPAPTVEIKSDEPDSVAIEVVAEAAQGDGATLEELNVEINVDSKEQDELDEGIAKLDAAQVSLESLVDYIKLSMESEGEDPVDMTPAEVGALTEAANDIIDEVGGETITISTEADGTGVVAGSTNEAKKTIGDRAKQFGQAVVEGIKKALAGLADLYDKLFDAATKAKGRANGIAEAIDKDARTEFKVSLKGAAVELKDFAKVGRMLKETSGAVLGQYSKQIATEARKATTGSFFQTYPAVPKAHTDLPGHPVFDEKGAFTWDFRSGKETKPTDATISKADLLFGVKAVADVMDLVLRYRSEWEVVKKALQEAVKLIDKNDEKAADAKKAVQESVRLISTGPRRFTSYAGQLGQQMLNVAAQAVKGTAQAES